MKVIEVTNRQRFDVYDRHQDTEGTVIIETESGQRIRISEDCFKGIDVCVERCDKRSVLSWSDEYDNTPTRVYNFDVDPVTGGNTI